MQCAGGAGWRRPGGADLAATVSNLQCGSYGTHGPSSGQRRTLEIAAHEVTQHRVDGNVKQQNHMLTRVTVHHTLTEQDILIPNGHAVSEGGTLEEIDARQNASESVNYAAELRNFHNRN